MKLSPIPHCEKCKKPSKQYNYNFKLKQWLCPKCDEKEEKVIHTQRFDNKQ